MGFKLEFIQKLVRRKIPLEDLVISKTFSKEHYVNPQVHVNLNDRIKKRDPTQAYALGQRIPFIITQGRGKLFERGESLQYIKDNCIPWDAEYYLDRQLKMPMTRLLVPLVGAVNGRLFFERARGDGLHNHFNSNKELWIPPVLENLETTVQEIKKKKRKAPVQKNTIDSFFKNKK